MLTLDECIKIKEHCREDTNCCDCPLLAIKDHPSCTVLHDKALARFGPPKQIPPRITGDRLYLAQFDDELQFILEEARLRDKGIIK